MARCGAVYGVGGVAVGWREPRQVGKGHAGRHAAALGARDNIRLASRSMSLKVGLQSKTATADGQPRSVTHGVVVVVQVLYAAETRDGLVL